MIVSVAATFVVATASPTRALALGDTNRIVCPPETEASEGFRSYLPDCRAYEQVTPSNKEGAVVRGTGRATVAADGSSVIGASTDAFAGLRDDELPALGLAYYRFSRTRAGWGTTPLNPVQGALESIGVEDSVWFPASIGLVVPHVTFVDRNGTATDVGPVWPPGLGPVPVPIGELFSGTFSIEAVAGSALLRTLFVLENPALLWPWDTTHRTPSLYEYTGTNNAAPRLVGVSSGIGNTQLVSQCGTTLGSSSFVGGGQREYNAVSADGRVTYFTAAGVDSVNCGAEEPPVNELFARIGGAQTVAISEPSAGDCPVCNIGAPRDARFEGASADGSKVFFTTTQPLLGADTSENLYEYDFDAPPGQPRVVRISSGATSAGVQGAARISEDGSHVYFVARGVLTSEPDHSLPSGHQIAQEGADNLYVYQRDAQYPLGHTSFVAELCTEAGKSGEGSDSECPSNLNPAFEVSDEAIWGVGRGDNGRPAQATPDGRFLAFTSYGDLTTDDTSTASQVFQYDAQAGTLVRVSIGEQGLSNNGNTTDSGHFKNNDATIGEQNYGRGSRGGAIARTMSDNGAYIFFQSPVMLTPQGLNDVPLGATLSGETRYAQNIYEYHGGNIYLISDGQDATAAEAAISNVQLLGTSASGEDVFFTTADSLVPQDTDTQVDFYDARVDGGFPAPREASTCQGENCQGALSAAPSLGTPGSATFNGLGNITPPPATTPKPETAAQIRARKLAKALKACKSKRDRHKRTACERQARKRYGPSHKTKPKARSHKGGK